MKFCAMRITCCMQCVYVARAVSSIRRHGSETGEFQSLQICNFMYKKLYIFSNISYK